MRIVPDAPVHVPPLELDRILAAGQPTLVVFEVPGSEPCRALGPTLEGLAREYAGRVLVVRVPADDGWLAARHHLTSVPTLVFWGDEREQARIKGNPGELAIRAHLEFVLTGSDWPEPAQGPRDTLVASFGPRRGAQRLRGLLCAAAAPAKLS